MLRELETHDDDDDSFTHGAPHITVCDDVLSKIVGLETTKFLARPSLPVPPMVKCSSWSLRVTKDSHRGGGICQSVKCV